MSEIKIGDLPSLEFKFERPEPSEAVKRTVSAVLIFNNGERALQILRFGASSLREITENSGFQTLRDVTLTMDNGEKLSLETLTHIDFIERFAIEDYK